MVKILIFFLVLVLASYYVTNAFIFVPLDLIKSLDSIFGYGLLAIALALTIWLMGD